MVVRGLEFSYPGVSAQYLKQFWTVSLPAKTVYAPFSVTLPSLEREQQIRKGRAPSLYEGLRPGCALLLRAR